jgi:chemotaxis protein histidine kinase CheA
VVGDSDSPALDAMGLLRDRARVTNVARLEVLTDALDRLRDGVLDEEQRLTARRAAHSLVGSAGTFGFGEASHLGRSLEALLDEAGEPERAVVRAAQGLELVAALRVALDGRTPS